MQDRMDGRTEPRPKPLLWLAAGLLVGAVGAAQVSSAFFGRDDPAPPTAIAPGGAPPSFADLYDRLRNSVVNLKTSRAMQHPPIRSPFGGRPSPFDEFFRRFGVPEGEMKQRSLGSGFVLDEEGHILTNHHVVQGADEVLVVLADGTQTEAEIVGRDPKTDIALIKVDVDVELLPVNLGNSDGVRVGDWVLSIGNPFGFTHTLTAGIVSAKGRVLDAGPYDDFIQTDAAINPGNSGGPLFDTGGRVIGVNTAIVSPSGGYAGVGFAIPIDLVIEILDDLKETGQVTRGWLGVMIQNLNEDMAETLGIETPSGALVADLVEEGPAAEAGLVRGDVIIDFAGTAIVDVRDLTRVVASKRPGTKAKVQVLRPRKGKKGATRKTVSVVVGTFPSESEEGTLAWEESGVWDRLGFEVQDLDAVLAERLGTDDPSGVVVTKVRKGGPADESGIKPGDVIREVNQEPVADVEGLRERLRGAGQDGPILVLLERQGHTRFATIAPAEGDE